MNAIMKSTVMTAVFFGMLVGSARAQGIVTVKVPFPFFVDHQEFPAGQYDVRAVEDMGSVLSIEGVKNRESKFVLTIPAVGGDPAGDQPALVFVRYEHTYRLSAIWESNRMGRELPGALSGGKVARVDSQGGPSDAREYVVAGNWK